MSDLITVARPYAKAAFEHALAQSELALWNDALEIMSQAMCDQQAIAFIQSPQSTVEQQSKLFMSLFAKDKALAGKKDIEHFVQMLAENKRLLMLPEIYALYTQHRAEHEKTLVAHVRSFMALTGKEQEEIIASLSQRLKRQISLDVVIDKSLLGGAVIRAGDLVIDGSVREKLNKLSAELAA